MVVKRGRENGYLGVEVRRALCIGLLHGAFTMAVGKNKGLSKGGKKGVKKKMWVAPIAPITPRVQIGVLRQDAGGCTLRT